MSRTGHNIIYQDFSSIYKRIVYSKSKRLELLDLLKKNNCTIFAAKLKAWNSWVETTQPICAFFVAETVFFLLMLLIIIFNWDVRCALNFAYCAITYVASVEYVIRTNRFKLHASGRFHWIW